MMFRAIVLSSVVLLPSIGPASFATSAAQVAASRPADLPMSVRASSTRVPPGSVTLLTISSPSELADVTADVLGRPIQFWRSATSREWLGLAGVPLDTEPRSYVVRVNAATIGGARASASISLSVPRKTFLTRRLTVDPKLAQPPKEEAERIAREAKLMAELFATVSPDRLWRGPWEPPVPGMATSSFGRLTITNGAPAGRHQGADFRAATGTPVRTPNGGRVVLAQNLYFAGNTVIVDHGLGIYSLLAHLSRIDVRTGDLVARGAPVGQSGATGRVTGPHLHWAVRFGETSVDPLSLIATLAGLSEGGASSRPGT